MGKKDIIGGKGKYNGWERIFQGHLITMLIDRKI